MLSNLTKLGGLVLVAVSIGCAALQMPTTELSATSLAAPPIAVIYRVAGQSSNPSTDSAANPLRATKTRVLSLKFPHSKCKPGYGRVELVIESSRDMSDSGSSLSRRFSNTLEDLLPGVRMAEGIDAAWTMDIRHAEVTQVLREMEAQGFFVDSPSAQDERVVLVAEIDGQTTARRWRNVSELDRLILRVQENGKLIGHVGQPLDVEALLPPSPQPGAIGGLGVPMVAEVSSLPAIERLPGVTQ